MSQRIRIDIVSDVVCPWCIVGYRQLQLALEEVQVEADIHWHPFELNPNMPAEGQNLTEHIMQKYVSTAEDSARARDRLAALGQSLGFTFSYSPDSVMRNTFRAHQLLHWAEDHGKATALKMALFAAYFTDQRDVNDAEVLADIAASVGLDRSGALDVVTENRFAAEVRGLQNFWLSKGIRGVPSMIFEQKHLMTGAQGAERYAMMLRQLVLETAQ